jgi:hypothetical protein
MLSKTNARMIRRTYRAPALHFCAANFKIWQARYTRVFFQFCVNSCEKPDYRRISTAIDALDLRGTVGFLASAESVTGLDEENSEFPYFSFPLLVGSTSDGAAKTIERFYRK